MKKAYIFDLDGTLVNSIYDIGDSINYLLTQRGFPPYSYKEYPAYMGGSIGSTLSKAMPGYDDLPKEEQKALRQAYIDHNGVHCLDKTRPYGGVEEVLEKLLAGGAVLGIYTNKPEVVGQKVSGAFFKKGTFQFLLGGVEGKTLKPNPERALKELERLGINPADAVFVGDSDVDIITGKNAGMIACGVAWGFKGREELEEFNPDVLISHPRELLEI